MVTNEVDAYRRVMAKGLHLLLEPIALRPLLISPPSELIHIKM